MDAIQAMKFLVLPLRSLWRRGCFALLCFVWLTPGPVLRGQAVGGEGDLFVATTGDDRWSGTLAAPNGNHTDGPFATLERAVQAIRQRKAAGQPSAHILIRTGTYFLSHTVELRPGDSTAGHPLVLAAYPGEQPVLDGGTRLSGTWQKSGQGPLWTLQIPDTSHPVEDLFVNGRRASRARLPQDGFWRAKAVGKSRTQFQFEPGQVQAWPDAANGVVVVKPYEWFDETLPIQSIDEKAQILTVGREGSYPLVSKDDRASGEYYIENIRAGLNRPGAWCYDAAQGVVTLWPPDGIDPNRAEVIAGGLPVMISLTGDVPGNQWVERVVLDGLTFRHAGRFAKWRHFGGAAVRLAHNVRDCEVRHCRFEDVGGSGVVVFKECLNVTVAGNEFTGTGDTPIYVFDYVGEGSDVSTGHVIENNSIHDCGTVERSIEGIYLGGTSHCRVDHNLIYNMPYLGIRLNGSRAEDWPAKASPGLKPPYTDAGIKPFVPTLDNVIEFNHIHHVMQKLQDGGGIYLWGVMGDGANIVRDNLIEHVGEGKGLYIGLYLDDHTDDARCTDNIVNDAGFGLHLHGASRNLLENNIFAYSRQTDISVQPEKYNVAPMDSILRHNIFFQCAGTVFLDTSFARWDMKPLVECDYNLFWQDGKKVQGAFAGFDRHSLVADPKFKDPAHGDFSLEADSPAIGLGIHAVDLRKAGLISGVGPEAHPLPRK
jgi:parallel beta-helix repeat protein